MMSLYWVALKTIWRKEITVLCGFGSDADPPVIAMSLYFIIFGNLIGNRIGEMGGVGYIQFVPGLIMMSVITNSYANVSSSFFQGQNSRKVSRNCWWLRCRPMSLSPRVCRRWCGARCAGQDLVTLISLFFCAVTDPHGL